MRTDLSARCLSDRQASDEPGRIFRLDAREFAWVATGSLVFAAVFLYPILCEIKYLGPGLHDWLVAAPHFGNLAKLPINEDLDMFDQLRWVPYYTLTHFHQWPFWNPFKCGGMSMLGNPESAIVTPFLLIYLAGGLLAGIFLEIYLHIAIAFVGGYVLGRELGLRPLACLVLAGMFPSSSWLPLPIAVGHLNFLPAAYFPWIIAIPAAIGGLFCALTLTEGNYTFLYAVMLVTIVAITFAWRKSADAAVERHAFREAEQAYRQALEILKAFFGCGLSLFLAASRHPTG